MGHDIGNGSDERDEKGKRRKHVYDRVNEYVEAHGTGWRKGEEKPYDWNVYVRFYELITDSEVSRCLLDQARKKNPDEWIYTDYENVYQDAVLKAAQYYETGKGAAFCTFFVMILSQKIIDAFRENEDVNSFEQLLESGSRDGERDNGSYGDVLEAKSRNAVSGEQMPVDEAAQESDRFEECCEVVYKVLKLKENMERTQGRMTRFFYTEYMMLLFGGKEVPLNRQMRHEGLFFDNLSFDMTEYAYRGRIDSLRALNKEILRNYGELIDHFDNDEGMSEKGREVYRGIWGKNALKKREETAEPPFKNIWYLAFLFALEYKEDKNVIPMPHPSAYVTKYKTPFEDACRAFLAEI